MIMAPMAEISQGVAVVVLSWNGKDDTLGCLASLAAVEYEPLEVIVVDNGSIDGSAEAVELQFPAAVVIRMGMNAGFSGGVNAGIEAALERGAQAVLLLNNDMVVEPGFLDPLVAAALEPGVAAACSQILFSDGQDRVWYAGARFRPRRGHHGRNIGFGEPPQPPSVAPYPVDCACGGAMLMSRAAITRVGLFDEELFAYREDLDWSLRAAGFGLQVLVVPASIVRHHVSASTGGGSSPTSLYYDLRNLLTVSERYAPLPRVSTLLRRLESVAAHTTQAVLSGRRRDGLRAVREGWRDFRSRRLGPRRERGAVARPARTDGPAAS
jgi:GT2 family glycosyltransferase